MLIKPDIAAPMHSCYNRCAEPMENYTLDAATGVWLVRHSQTVANAQRRYQSWSDSPLTEYGQRQAAALAAYLRATPFDIALVSPSRRTHAAADAILAGRADVTRLEAPAWVEIHHGQWEGLTYDEVQARFPADAAARWEHGIDGRAIDGESLAETAQRIGGAWSDLVQRYSERQVLIVTHATPIQLALCVVLGLPPTAHWRWRIDLASVTCIDLYPDGGIVRMVNQHIEEP